MKNRASLFSEFDAVSSKEFKQKIQFDLKGLDYNDTLLWHSHEGIDVKPFYHRDEVKIAPAIPHTPHQWRIGESIFILNAKQSAQTANQAVASGAEAIYFTADEPFNIEELFKELEVSETPLYFNLNFLDAEFYIEVYAYAKKFSITLKLDIINHLVLDGNWYQNLKQDHEVLKAILIGGEQQITVDTRIYQNAGATMIQQLAYGLAHFNEYLNYCVQEKVTLRKITFQMAVGTNYFFEIAKLRSLRQLVEILLEDYKTSNEDSLFSDTYLEIIVHPTRRNKTLYDYNSNMLRTTTECMSAILGGANCIVNLPYDAIYHKTNNFGQRIARNQLILLREESYFDAVSNPADGAYYIEELTRQIGEKSLAIFKDIERQGGFLKQLKEGTIQRKVKESAQKEQQQFDDTKIVLVGTNKYVNAHDRMKDTLELYPFLKIKPRKTLINPIIPKRLAEALEQQRLKDELN